MYLIKNKFNVMKKEKLNQNAKGIDKPSVPVLNSKIKKKKRTLGVDTDKRDQLMIQQLETLLNSPDKMKELFEKLSSK